MLATGPSRPPPAQLAAYPTRYYTIYSDLEKKDVREAAMRITTMADEYARLTLRAPSYTVKRFGAETTKLVPRGPLRVYTRTGMQRSTRGTSMAAKTDRVFQEMLRPAVAETVRLGVARPTTALAGADAIASLGMSS